jgi:hypothetical protein
MANKHGIGITEEQKAKAIAALKKRATGKSFESLLRSEILSDIADPRASVGFGKRCAIRALLGLPEIMEVDYDLTFEQMMVNADLPESSMSKVLTKLGSKKIEFDFCGKLIFEYENVDFGRPVSTKVATDHIYKFDSEWSWHPFCIAQLLTYIKLHPERYYSNFVCALSKIVEIDGKQHVFAVGTLGKKPDLDLVPAHGHQWPKQFHFPKYRKV